MKFDKVFLDELRARIPVSQVVSRSVQLKRAGREYKGLSPFKDERTPSFTVNDQKGFYHCFATGEHGDIFSFLVKTEGLAFPEAVKQLAEIAGVAVPKPENYNPQREQQRDRLLRLMERACSWFEQQLAAPKGDHARRYLDRRGLSQEVQKRFRMGFGPDNRSALKEFLLADGFTDAEIILSGMAIGGDDIAVSYDRFRDRVMFPIEDASGRVIAFGGRALSPDARAKYLNSPETPLFHKGSVLFNYKRARKTAFDEGNVLAVEGYMDVIALAAAGFDNAVAPLGTALTENQLSLLWRMADEPTVCFDGDAAGIKAAHRALDVALPLVDAGKSLRFCFMPDGQDPDDLLKESGPAGMRDALAKAQPMIDVLWNRELMAGEWSTPERRAKLEQNLSRSTGSIRNDTIRNHYQAAFQERLRELWGDVVNDRAPASRQQSGQRKLWSPNTRPRPGQSQSVRDVFAGRSSRPLQRSALVHDNTRSSSAREALILSTLVNHPDMLDDNAEELASINFTDPNISACRNALLDALALELPLDREALRAHLTRNGFADTLEAIDSAQHGSPVAFARLDARDTDVRSGWRHTVALHRKSLQLKDELEQASRVLETEFSERALKRVTELSRLLQENEAGSADLDVMGSNAG